MKTDRERQIHMMLLICGIYNMIQTSLFTKQKQNGPTDTNEEGWGRAGWAPGADTDTLLYLKQITSKALLYSTGNSARYSVITQMGEESEKRMNVCITESLCCTPETNNIVNRLYSNTKYILKENSSLEQY